MIIARREGRCGVTRMAIRVIIRREIFTWSIPASNILWKLICRLNANSLQAIKSQTLKMQRRKKTI